MFPCKQMEVNNKYRKNYDKIFGKEDKKEKLKPCPFCGCKDIIEYEAGDKDFKCPKCFLIAGWPEIRKEKARDMWNSRIK